MRNKALVTQGNFQWAGGIKDTTVNFIPDNNGRFLVSWIPPARLQNRVIIKNGVKYPGNEHVGALDRDWETKNLPLLSGMKLTVVSFIPPAHWKLP